MILDVSNWKLDCPQTNTISKIEELALTSQDIVVKVRSKDFDRIVNNPSCYDMWKEFLRIGNGYTELPKVYVRKLTSKQFRFLSIDWKIIEEE